MEIARRSLFPGFWTVCYSEGSLYLLLVKFLEDSGGMFGSSFDIHSNTRPPKKLIKCKQFLAPTYLLSFYQIRGLQSGGGEQEAKAVWHGSKGPHGWNFKRTI